MKKITLLIFSIQSIDAIASSRDNLNSNSSNVEGGVIVVVSLILISVGVVIIEHFIDANKAEQTTKKLSSIVKPNTHSSIQDPLSSFQGQFSQNQRKAIMCSLFLIANSDGEFHRNEIDFFEQTGKLLGFKVSTNYSVLVDEFMKMEREQLFQYLNSLDEGQKDWYIVTAFGMIHSDGKALQEEFLHLEVFFKKMGITHVRFENTIKKADQFSQLFG